MIFARLISGLFIFSVSFLNSTAQEFIHYNLADGLSGMEVTDIDEDENYLWIATTDGLNRFDGKNFKIFRHEPDNPNSLGENYIESLYFDSDELLWIGLKSGGADIYDAKYERFIHLRDVIDAKVPIRVITIIEDSQKNIWLGTWEEGLYKLAPVKGSRKHYTVEIHYPGYIVSSLAEKPSGFLRVGTYFGFFTYDIKEKKWIESDHKNVSVTQFLDTGEENEIWCSTWNSGVFKLIWNTNNAGSVNFGNYYRGDDFNSVFRMEEGIDGSIFLGTWGKGISNFNFSSSTAVTYLPDDYLKSALINTLHRDKHNYIWAGSYGEGLIRFSDKESSIYHFPVSGRLLAPATCLASVNRNTVLLGTQGSGLFSYDMSKNTLSALWANTGQGDLRNYILSLYADDAFLFVGHDGKGIPYRTIHAGLRRDKSFTIAEYPLMEKITAVYRTNDGLIWLGTKQNGLFSFRINPGTGRPESFLYYEDFPRDEITGITKFNDTTLLVSTHGGLFRLNTYNGIIKKEELVSPELIYNMISDQKKSCIWIGSSTGVMLLKYDSISQLKQAFDGYGLPQGAVRSMILDKKNNLWFSIGERLFCYHDSSMRVREINPVLSGNKAILSSTVVQSERGEQLVFGTTDNLIIIDPERLLDVKDRSKIVLTDLQIDHRRINAGDKVFGRVVMDKAAEFAASIDLSYRCRWITFQFVETRMDLFVNRYQYYIEGFSDQWQYLNISNPLTFSQLHPGKYILRIRMYGNGPDQWTLGMNIIPPWWQTGWFRILLFVFIAGISLMAGYFFIRYSRKKHTAALRRIEKEKEDELLREKESFFTGLSHDLMTPFSLIISPANEVLREYPREDGIKEKLRIIKKNASFLSDIFGTILDFKRAELSDDTIKTTQFEVVAFSRLVVHAFEYLANSRNIILCFKSNVEALEIVSDNVKIERILFNLVSNAIKFTPDGGKVEVELKYNSDHTVILIVRDNGFGIDLAKQSRVFEKFYSESEGEFHRKNKGLGLGLYIVRKFTDRLNGTINITSAPAEGTRITVSIPVQVVQLNAVVPANPEAVKFTDDRPTILIVEDNAELLDYLGNKLTGHFNVISAVNGNEALEFIEKLMPEIIISDVIMQGMDGLSLTRRIKEDNKYADIFVVLLTARISSDDELEGYRQGADIYIRKPFDGDALLNQMINIHNTIRKRKGQLISWLVSGEQSKNPESDPKNSFIKNAIHIVEEHIMETDFRIDEFASAMNMSKTVLHRKFNLLIGQTPNQFIRLVRLRKSLHLLKHTDHTVAEIAYLTGFNQSHYFIKCFRDVYHKTPGEFRTTST